MARSDRNGRDAWGQPPTDERYPEPYDEQYDHRYADHEDSYGQDDPGSHLAAGALVRTLRALSGSVAAGLALLTLVVIVTAVIGSQRGFPGPGAMSIGVHAGGTVVAALLQRFADRRRDFTAILASLAVCAVAGGVLWTQWWN